MATATSSSAASRMNLCSELAEKAAELEQIVSTRRPQIARARTPTGNTMPALEKVAAARALLCEAVVLIAGDLVLANHEEEPDA